MSKVIYAYMKTQRKEKQTFLSLSYKLIFVIIILCPSNIVISGYPYFTLSAARSKIRFFGFRYCETLDIIFIVTRTLDNMLIQNYSRNDIDVIVVISCVFLTVLYDFRKKKLPVPPLLVIFVTLLCNIGRQQPSSKTTLVISFP